MSNKIAEFAVKTLREYTNEEGLLPRSTSDLSPLEEWLIIKLFNEHDNKSNTNKTSR